MDDQLVSMLYDVLGISVVAGDRLRVLGAVAGPAGSSAMDLPDGGTWEVDHLDPSIPVRFEVDLVGADRSPLLIAAFGGDGALYLSDEAVDRSSAHVTITSRPGRDDYSVRRGAPSAHDPDLMAGRVVVLCDLATDTASDPLVQVAAVAELLSKAYAVSGGELLLSVLPVMRRTAGELAQEVTDDELFELDPRVAVRFERVLTRISGTGPGGGPLGDLAGRIRDVVRARVPRVAPPTSGSFPEFDTDGPVVLPLSRAESSPPVAQLHADRSVIVERTDEYLDLQRMTPTTLRVTVTRSDRRRWIRVVRDPGSVPLAQAPLRRSDLVEVADLVVPAAVADDEMRIEVIDPEELYPIGGGPMELVRRAVELGRTAARLERVDEPSVAATTWERCADVWQALGDPDRAGSARRFARGIDSGPHLEPYLADEIAVALDRARPTS